MFRSSISFFRSNHEVAKSLSNRQAANLLRRLATAFDHAKCASSVTVQLRGQRAVIPLDSVKCNMEYEVKHSKKNKKRGGGGTIEHELELEWKWTSKSS